MKLKIIKGDITEIQADAIVNAANEQLWMGAGVAGAIKRKGGIEIEREAIAKGPIEHGGAIETSAGNLKAKYVIHAAGMRSDGYITEVSLADSVRNSLNIAERLKLKSIAFPAIGTGVAGFPAEKCAEIMFGVIKKHQIENLEEIILVLFSEELFSIFVKEIGSEEKVI